ncbi:MAG: AIR synthase-related protein, partial [candidate division WOR-3 bacterium]|nr:AIR synthase-related protein [candidate division WOR-3 bacterium]
AISVIDNIDQTLTADFKFPNNLIYLVGRTMPEFGVPKVFPKQAKPIFEALHRAIKARLVTACHDISSDGFIVSLAEMTFANSIGVEIHLNLIKPKLDMPTLFFSKSNSRFICSVPIANQKKFESIMSGLPLTLIGRTNSSGRLKIYNEQEQPIVSLTIDELFNAWRQGLAPM